MLRLTLIMTLLLANGCDTALRARGSSAQNPRPAFQEVRAPDFQYKVWVMVPSLRVHTYPLQDQTQQPMLQFTGDRDRLASGLGQMTMLVAPDLYHDGDHVDFFADKVLWTDRLEPADPRTFTLWLRENNRSVPTRYDAELKQVGQVAQAIEEVSGAIGFKIPARRAINISNQALKELQRDWLIMRWTCPWRHVLKEVQTRLAGSHRHSLMLSARIVSKERRQGKPVAEVMVLFVIQKLQRPLPAVQPAAIGEDVKQ